MTSDVNVQAHFRTWLALLATCGMLSGCGPKSEPATSSRPRRTPSATGSVIHVTEANFSREVERANGVVVVDFWATWCGPCKVIAPTLEKLAREYRGKVKVCKVDIDKNKKLANRFKIRSIPTLLLFVNGQEKDDMNGARSEKDYRAWFDKYAKGR